MDIDTLAALAVFAMLIWYVRDRLNAKPETPPAKAPLHCMDCGSDFTPTAGPARGNGAIELVLYLFMIFPGIMYSIWRRSGQGKRPCRVCGSDRTVPASSPAAVAHRKSLQTGE
jgi:hypothetical protein